MCGITFVADKVKKIRMCQPIACQIIVTYALSHYLKMCHRLFKNARVLKFVLSNHHHPYFVSASSDDSGETAQMRSLARVLVLAYAISNNTLYIIVLCLLQEALLLQMLPTAAVKRRLNYRMKPLKSPRHFPEGKRLHLFLRKYQFQSAPLN